jgi:hypothetical protein
MSNETTGIVRYGETSPIVDVPTRYGLAGELTDHNGPPLQETGIPGFITEEQLARQLGVALSTVRRWRRRGYGPKFVKVGRKDYCKETAAADFAAELLAEAERAAEPRRRGRPRR